jgi:acetyl-CoA carboxylase carboxyl transferase subunit beta
MTFKDFVPRHKKRAGGQWLRGAQQKRGNRARPCALPQMCQKRAERRALEKLCALPYCGYHYRISARKRISLLADRNSFNELYGDLSPENLLGFPEYDEKLNAAAKKSGEREAVICGEATIGGHRCCMFAMEGLFMMGSMGTVVGDKITLLFEHALLESLPVIGVTISGGARMQEGMCSLMQMAKVSAAVKRHGDAGNLYIALLTDPTTGGVTASFAMLGDILLAEPGALIGFAGPRVVEQTMGKPLPPGFQRSEMLLKCGFIDEIVPRPAQKEYITGLLRLHSGECAYDKL